MPRGTTPFVRKTWDLLADKELSNVVSWTRNGETFAILDSDNFAANVLPKYFKHGNLCSFVRQLNTYGFKKVTIRDCNDLEFKHKLFHRDHEELLPHIVRRTAGSKEEETEGNVQEELLYQLVETNKKLARRLKQLEENRAMADKELHMMRQELRQTKDFAYRLSVFQRKVNFPPQRYPSPAPQEGTSWNRGQPAPPRPAAPPVYQTQTPFELKSELEWSTLGAGSAPPSCPTTEASPELQPLPFPHWEPLNITEDFFAV